MGVNYNRCSGFIWADWWNTPLFPESEYTFNIEHRNSYNYKFIKNCNWLASKMNFMLATDNIISNSDSGNKSEKVKGPATHFFWNWRSLSCSRSLMSIPFPFSRTSGCFRQQSQPIWEKKNPRLALWGSALVSLYLWCTLWSRAHSITWF